MASDPFILEVIDELNRRENHLINQYEPGNIPGWDQESFHKSLARHRLLFGGNRSGKSQSAAYEAACWLRGQSPYRTIPEPPNHIWCISVEYDTIYEGIYRHLREIIPDWEIASIGAKLPNQRLPSYIELKNGSDIKFKSAKGGEEARVKFQAASTDLIIIDEEVPGDIIEELGMRQLDRAGSMIISATLVESYDWIIELEDLADKGTPDYFVTRLETEHNPHLDAQAVADAKAKMSDEDLQVRFYGKSRRSTGLVYNTFRAASTKDSPGHVIKPFEIPYDWPRWCALDPGIRTFGVLWMTCDKKKFYIYRELYLKNIPLYEVAYAIKTAEGWTLNTHLSEQYGHHIWEETDHSEHMVERLIDPSAISRLTTGEQGIADQLHERYGLLCTPADNSKRPGIEACRYMLGEGLQGALRLGVFDSCESFIWEIKRYRIREKKLRKGQSEPIDDPIKRDDHLMDCWRYIAMSNPKWEDRRYMTNIQQNTELIQPIEDEYEHEFLGTSW